MAAFGVYRELEGYRPRYFQGTSATGWPVWTSDARQALAMHQGQAEAVAEEAEAFWGKVDRVGVYAQG